MQALQSLATAANLASNTGKRAAAEGAVTPVSVTLLDSGTDTGSKSTYASASVTPSADKLILAVAAYGKAAPTADPTVSGCGLTWEQIDTVAIILNGQRLGVWRAVGVTPAVPTTDVVTFDFAGNTHTYLQHAIVEVNDARIDGTNGAGAIGAQNSGTNLGATTTAALAMPSFTDYRSATLGIIHTRNNSGVTPGSGFAEVIEVASAIPRTLFVEFKDTPNSVIDASWVTSDFYAAIGLELKVG